MLTAALVAGALLAPAPAHTAAKRPDRCPEVGTTLARETMTSGRVVARVFRRKGVVSACSTAVPKRRRPLRLGRFTPRLVAVDEVGVIWTRRAAEGTDTVSTYDLTERRREVDRRPAVPARVSGEARGAAAVETVATSGGFFRWSTALGDLVVGDALLTDPMAITRPDGTTSEVLVDQGAAAIDRLPELTAAQRTAVLTAMTLTDGPNDGDECEVIRPWTWSWTTPAGTSSATARTDYRNPDC